jgi:hypothetical protein
MNILLQDFRISQLSKVILKINQRTIYSFQNIHLHLDYSLG